MSSKQVLMKPWRAPRWASSARCAGPAALLRRAATLAAGLRGAGAGARVDGQLQVVDVDAKLQEVAVEDRLGRVQQVVRLAPDVLHDVAKAAHQRLQALDVRLLRRASRPGAVASWLGRRVMP